MQTTTRDQLEAISRHAAIMYARSVNDGLADIVAAEATLFRPLRQSLSALASALIGLGLAKKNGKSWMADDRTVAALDEGQLEALARLALAVVEEAEEPAVLEALIAEDQGFFLAGVHDTETALRAFGYTTPNSRLLKDAIAVEDEVRIVEASEVPEARLHDIAKAALALLDVMHGKVPVAESRELFRIDAAVTDLKDALRGAAYLIPGDSAVRTAPCAEQSSRGTREELERIRDAAQALVDTIGPVETLARLVAVSGGDLATQLAAREIGGKFGLLVLTLENARPETTLRVEAAPQSGRILPWDLAETIAAAFDAGARVAEEAQLDTLSPHHVMFPLSSWKTMRAALDAADSRRAEDMLIAVANGFDDIAGLRPEHARAMTQMLRQMRGILSVSEPRGTHRAAVMEEMDALQASSDYILTSGAYLAIAAHARRGGLAPKSLVEGRGTASFATLGEALAAGRSALPDRSVAPAGRAQPEMTTTHYNRLPESEKRRCRAFVIEPGKGLFEGYESSSLVDTRAARYRQARIREHLRGLLAGENGTPNKALRDLLIGLARRSIVAPNLDEAIAVRQLSEKLIADERRRVEARRETWIAGADKLVARFEAADIARFLRSLDASGSETFPTLVKDGTTLRLEHPEAPTITAEMEEMGRLERARDGYRLHKIDPAALRAALEGAAEEVAIHLTDDRPALIAAA